MIPSDALIASVCASIYSVQAELGAFDHYDAGLDDGICWGIKRIDGYDIVCLRGSVTFEDWLRDFRAIGLATRVGTVHAGFYQGMEHAWADIKPLLEGPAIVCGHSLGAARADVLTVLMICDGVRPEARVVFGEPKPGFLDHAAIVGQVPGRSYRNGDSTHHDLVTDVPFWLPSLPFVHPTPIIPVTEVPEGSLFERMGVFAWHSIKLYAAALTTLARAA